MFHASALPMIGVACCNRPMLTGEQLGKALAAAITLKGVPQREVAEAFGVQQSSVSEWTTFGRISKRHLTLLVTYFADVVKPEHWGLPAHWTPGYTMEAPAVAYAGQPQFRRMVPVAGEARLGADGYYEEVPYSEGERDGTIEGYSSDPGAYALRVKGDSMHPAIRHGAFVVVEPNGRCVPGEYVAIALLDDRKMVKELVIERADEVVVESVNGAQRQTLERKLIRQMHPVAAVVAASKWRPA